MTGHHAFAFAHYDTVCLDVIGRDHVGMHQTQIWLATVLLVVVARGLLHALFESNRAVVVPEHSNFHR